MRASGTSSPRTQKAGKLDVELGKAVGIQRTKAGSGDKEEAFLIRSTLLKFAGAFCLIFLVVGGLAIFLSQWEVSFQKGINLDERVEHQAVEQEAFSQFMQVGGLLTSFLREETGKKSVVNVVSSQVQLTVDALLSDIKSTSSSDQVQKLVEAFSDKIYNVLDEYSDMVAGESESAKTLLAQLNNLMADDDVMPASHEKIRPAASAKNGALQRTKDGWPSDNRRHDPHARPDRGAKQKLAALGGDLDANLKRIFDRVDALSQLSFPDNVKDGLVELQHQLSTAMGQHGKLSGSLLEHYKQLLSSPGVRGVDVSAATSSGKQMAVTLKEIVQLFPVLDHVDDLETLKLKFESHTLNESETMHELHKMTRDHILPFEWVAGNTAMKPGREKSVKAGRSSLFAKQDKYEWWTGLAKK